MRLDGRRRRERGGAAATLALLGGSALLLSGCAGGGLSTPDVRTPVAYEGAGAGDPSLSPAALDAWWRLYDDAQLTGLVEEALANSPDARTGLERIAQARASRAQTLDLYLPQGSLSGQASNQNTSESFGNLGVTTSLNTGGAGAGVSTGTTGTTGGAGAGGSGASSGAAGTTSSSGAYLTPSGQLQTYAAAFNISYEFDLFGRRRAAKRAADADLWAQRFDYEAVRSSLATNVASQLFQARGDAIQLADARENLRIATELARSAQLSADRGLTSTSDAARLQSDAASDEAEVERLEGVTRAARRTLIDLVGRGTAPLASLPVAPVTASPPAPPATTPGELLERRPDVREAEARLRSAAGTLALDKLALFPDFQLAPGYQLAKTLGSYDSFSTVWTVGMNATMPILDRVRLLAAVRGQRAVGEQAVIAYEKTVQDAYRDAENGLNTLDADRRRTKSLQRAEAQARFAFDAKRRGYDLGLTDLTTLLDAERTWRLSRAAYTTAEIQALVDSATLFQALGGGWTPPPLTHGPTLAEMDKK